MSPIACLCGAFQMQAVKFAGNGYFRKVLNGARTEYYRSPDAAVKSDPASRRGTLGGFFPMHNPRLRIVPHADSIALGLVAPQQHRGTGSCDVAIQSHNPEFLLSNPQSTLHEMELGSFFTSPPIVPFL